jgi:hypothetical protein
LEISLVAVAYAEGTADANRKTNDSPIEYDLMMSVSDSSLKLFILLYSVAFRLHAFQFSDVEVPIYHR